MLEYRDIATLKKLPGNPRIIKDRQFQQLIQSITANRDYFEARPIILSDRTGELVIIAGNMRYEAAKHIGMNQVPTFLIKGLDEAREKEIVIRDNVSNGEWDWDALANEWDAGPLADWGLEFPEPDKPESDLSVDDYTVPEEIKTDIKPGDLITIGHHKLLCADATIESSVNQLFEGGGGRPILMVTDPPYGVDYDPNWRNEAAASGHLSYGASSVGKVTRDNRSDWGEAFSTFTGDIIYCWHAGRHAKTVQHSIEQAGFKIINQIIWAKDIHVISRGDYHWKHEPCWYAVRKSATHNWQGSRSETTLWDIPRGCKEKTGHSTEKPVECMGRPIRNNTAEGQIVYDPFLGSGTTMVAAHKLNRICYAIELEPKWCQVTIDRMLKLDPSLPVTINGTPYKPAVNTEGSEK